MPTDLSDKQQRFVAEYLIDLNATAAYKRAGYRAEGRSAENSASRLLGDARVQAAIQAAQAQRAHEVEVTQGYILSNLTEIVERCMQRAPVCDAKGVQITDNDGRNVWTFNSKGAIGSLTLLGKHLGMFKDQVDFGDKPLVVKVLKGVSLDDL